MAVYIVSYILDLKGNEKARGNFPIPEGQSNSEENIIRLVAEREPKFKEADGLAITGGYDYEPSNPLGYDFSKVYNREMLKKYSG